MENRCRLHARTGVIDLCFFIILIISSKGYYKTRLSHSTQGLIKIIRTKKLPQTRIIFWKREVLNKWYFNFKSKKATQSSRFFFDVILPIYTSMISYSLLPMPNFTAWETQTSQLVSGWVTVNRSLSSGSWTWLCSI